MATTLKKNKKETEPTEEHDTGKNMTDGTKEKPSEQEVGIESPETTLDFVERKKTEMKNSLFRQRFDALYLEFQNNIIQTNPAQTQTSLANSARWTFATTYTNGNMNVFPMLSNDRDNQMTKVPNSKEPIAFTKILIASAALGSNVPDGTFESENKVFARCFYELWKRTWENPLANGKNTLGLIFQGLFSYGVSMWRVYPREVTKPKGKSKKIEFDDIYREWMDPSRTWLGTSVNNYDGFSRGECYYEKDMPKPEFMLLYPEADEKDLCYLGQTQESKDEKPNARNIVTVEYYENDLTNRYVVKSGKYIITDGQLPNDDTFGHMEWANCFIRDANDPYGVGLYELARGNAAMNDYISGMTAIQVEAEIYPLIFGANIGNGEMKYRRGPFIVNPKMNGSALDVVKTSGNISAGIEFADKQKQIINSNTGVNDILGGEGASGTLGETVILKEAALQRLTLPRNSVARALERDAYKTVSWIMQTYSVEKVDMFDTEDEFKEFVLSNPGLFIQKRVEKTKNKKNKYIAVHSPKVSVNFDFNGNKLIDKSTEPIQISRSALMQELKNSNNLADVLLIQIDPDAMLIPSQEINKQQTLELYQLVTAQTIQIFQTLPVDPDLARTLYTQLLQVLKVYKQNPLKWIPKDLSDKLMQASSQNMTPPNQGPETKPISEIMNFKDVPPDVQNQMIEKAGMQVPENPTEGQAQADQGVPVGPGALSVRAPTIGEIPAPSNPIARGMGMKRLNQGTRTYNPIRDSINASVGRAAKSKNKVLSRNKK